MNVYEELQTEIDISEGLIRAAEPWSDQYKKDQETFVGLTTTEARLERHINAWLRGLANRTLFLINWAAVQHIKAYDVEVLINEDELDNQAGLIAQFIFEDIAAATALGAQAGETVYAMPIGIHSTDAAVQRLTTEQVASLIGKRVDKNGIIIDNPNAKYRITDAIRKDISSAIKTGVNLRETETQMVDRVRTSIRNKNRATIIAQTESVNAYQNGMLEFGNQAGAVGKESLTINTQDICGVNAKAGIIKLNATFPSGHKAPAYHPRCRCSLRLVFPSELEQQQ